ncbi:Lipoprotein-anchoring transpeptidase ErfK/SrfK [Faunimonas pinastri]|uniref:Lipoprotein-anchoring transpeptidase ErfK/SrfK n=1 Tax=Faunimonas pinastri TaxID=1855383 RepID=A0A1H8ZIH6_9HYPH|nr:L,D-transpeptidase [Faunimonas pinastri]SEP64220.1 Lipoprotein-anchoring transpeptidase ErfK/SrfK [Faunimonas pinastri]
MFPSMKKIPTLALLALGSLAGAAAPGVASAQHYVHPDPRVEQQWIDQLQPLPTCEPTVRAAPVRYQQPVYAAPVYASPVRERAYVTPVAEIRPVDQRRGLLQVMFAPQPDAVVIAPPPRAIYVVPNGPTAIRPAMQPVSLISPGAPSVQAAPARTVAPEFLPTVVNYNTSQAPGTIVIDTSSRHLYLVMAGGKARRYGVGVGREGFAWSGTAHIGRKAEWPTWTPPSEMRKRQPYLPASMAGGTRNPLGARAMYLYRNGQDTLFRIHGSNEPWTIGHAVSSGCIRMRNEDVTDLYSRVGVGTTVVVR